MKVIGVTGMPGSGKSVVSRVAKSLGMKVVRMGDVIREEARIRNQDSGYVAVKLRQEYGELVVAERCIEIIKNYEQENADQKIPSSNYLIEGIRSPYEVDIFKQNYPGFKVISVYSKPKTRLKRLKKRMRTDDSTEVSEMRKRDQRELNFGIGEVIVNSDYMVINEGHLGKLKNTVRGIIENEMQGKG